jgi:hypothetical protein
MIQIILLSATFWLPVIFFDNLLSGIVVGTLCLAASMITLANILGG